MAPTVADYLLERLRGWDVEHVFAYAGDGINGILAAWGRAENKPQFIQARHEEMAAFEAVGYAKFTGRVGVCMATSGPGAIHLLNGLYDAKLDHVPVVAIVGQTSRSAMGGSYQQEVDLLSLFKDVASEYVQMVTVPEQLPNVLDRAIRTAIAERAPTAIIIPSDVQELDYSPPSHAFKMVPSSLGVDWPTALPGDEAINRAADVLNSSARWRSWPGKVPVAPGASLRRWPSYSEPESPNRCWARTSFSPRAASMESAPTGRIGYSEEHRSCYEEIEQELPVAGERWPWGDPHGYPLPAASGRRERRGLPARCPQARDHRQGGSCRHRQRPVRQLGRAAFTRGFCLQGCKVNAKASPLITHVPDALAHGAEVRADAMVTRVAVDERTGRTTGVHYVRGGKERFQRAAMVAVAGYSIETPRLLLNSVSSRFPDGLCNDFDQVGRYLMVQGAPQTAGRFERRGTDVQGAAARGEQRGVLRDRPGQGLPARVRDPDGLAAADHLGRTRRRAGTLGSLATRVHE